MVDRVIEIRGRGARGVKGDKGDSSGPLGANTVGASEVKSDQTSLRDIRAKLVATAVPISLYASLAAANTAAGLRPLFFSAVPLNITSATTITAPIQDTLEQIFTTASAQFLTIDNGQPVRPEWFGMDAGNIRLAVNVLPATGGTVLLSNRRYPASYNTLTGTGSTAVAGVDYLAKPNVRIVGVGRPKPNNTRTRMLDGSGTIINDMFVYWADNFTAEGFAIDSGADFCFANYGGTAREGLISVKPGQAAFNETSSPNRRGLTLRNVGAICKEPGAPVHCVLMEAYDEVSATDIETCFGIHGTVGKIRYSNLQDIKGYGHDGEDLVLKADSYAPLNDVNVTNVRGRAAASGSANDNGRAVQIYCATASAAASITISNVRAVRKAVAVEFRGVGLSDCSVTGLKAEGCDTGVVWNGDVRRCSVDTAVINNCSQAAITLGSADLSNSLTNAKITNVSSVSAVNVADGKLTMDGLNFEGVLAATAQCVRVSTGVVRIGRISGKNGTFSSFMNATPALVNGYANVAGEAPFLVLLQDGRVNFFGKLNTGTDDLITTLATWLRPSVVLTLPAVIFNGVAATRLPAFIEIRVNGEVRLQGRPTEAGSYVVLNGVSFADTFLPT